jgi:hypothetical protein
MINNMNLKLILSLLTSLSVGSAGAAFKFYTQLKESSTALEDSHKRIEKLIEINNALIEQSASINKSVEMANHKIDTLMHNGNATYFLNANSSTITIVCLLGLTALIVTSLFFMPSLAGIEKVTKETAIENLEISSKINTNSDVHLCSAINQYSNNLYDMNRENLYDIKNQLLSAIQFHHNYIREITFKLLSSNSDADTKAEVLKKAIESDTAASNLLASDLNAAVMNSTIRSVVNSPETARLFQDNVSSSIGTPEVSRIISDNVNNALAASEFTALFPDITPFI